MTNGVISVIDAETRPGLLKGELRTGGRDKLNYELRQAGTNVLHQGQIVDPSVNHLEYADSTTPGGIKRVVIPVPDIEFVIRVPYFPQANKLIVKRPTIVVAGPSLQAQAVDQIIGEFDLSEVKEGTE
jgi:hypothetical protein